MRSPTLVGRTAELGTLDRVLAAARGGRGGLVLVTGEAGIGTSRLLGEARRRADAAGMTVLTGRAVTGSGRFRPIAEAFIEHLRGDDTMAVEELRPYRRALRRMVPGWDDNASTGADRWEPDPIIVLGEGVLGLQRIAGDGGCVVCAEELHWADDDTVALLEYLARPLGHHRVAVVVTSRDEPTTRGHSL